MSFNTIQQLEQRTRAKRDASSQLTLG